VGRLDRRGRRERGHLGRGSMPVMRRLILLYLRPARSLGDVADHQPRAQGENKAIGAGEDDAQREIRAVFPVGTLSAGV